MEVDDANKGQKSVEIRAQCLDGKLLIDLLLELAGIGEDDTPLYPPQTDMQAESLQRMVEESVVFGSLERNCLKYYLQMDQSAESAAQYAEAMAIPTQFVKSTLGYWQLDHGQLTAGVRSLSYPGVVPDFLPSIIHLLSSSPKDLVALVRQAKVLVNTSAMAQSVIAAFVQVGNPAGAFRWARTDDSQHEAHLHVALCTAFGANENGRVVKSALKSLLNLSLDDDEDAVFMSFAQNPPAKLQPGNRDMLAECILTRLIAQGRYIEASKMIDADALKPSNNQAARRRALLKKGLFSVMSDLDASILDIEQQDPLPRTNGIEIDGEDHEEHGDIARLPWAPAPEVPEQPQAQSLADVQANAASSAAANRNQPIQPQNIPLSASPAFRRGSSQVTKSSGQATGESIGLKNVVSALRASSYGNLIRKSSFTNLQSPHHSPKASASPRTNAPYSASATSPYWSRSICSDQRQHDLLPAGFGSRCRA